MELLYSPSQSTPPSPTDTIGCLYHYCYRNHHQCHFLSSDIHSFIFWWKCEQNEAAMDDLQPLFRRSSLNIFQCQFGFRKKSHNLSLSWDACMPNAFLDGIHFSIHDCICYKENKVGKPELAFSVVEHLANTWEFELTSHGWEMTWSHK